MLFIKIEVYRMVGGGGGRVFHRNIWLLIESGSFQVALVVKNLPANAGDPRDVSSIPESGRSHGGGNGYPLQYSCLENSMDRGAWQITVHRAAKSWT